MSDLSHQRAFRLIYKRRLTTAEQSVLRSHLQHCAACRQDAKMAGLFSEHLALKTLPTRPSPQFTAVFKENAARRSRRSQIMKPMYAVGGTVALALIVLVGWFITRPMFVGTPVAIKPIEITQPETEPIVKPEVETAVEVVPVTRIAPLVAAAGETLDEQLIAAVEAGDLAEVTQLLDRGANPDFIDEWGQNAPLPLAAQAGQLEIAQLLLDAGADVNGVMDGFAPDRDPVTRAPALLYAAAEGNLDVVDLLLASGADPNQVEEGDGDTPLHHAAWFNHPQIVKSLLENGAELNVQRTDADGATPLHWAAGNGSLEAAQVLLQAGADVDIKDPQFGNTALMYTLGYARENGRMDMLSLLLDAGADANAASDRGKTPLMAAIQNEELIDLAAVLTALLDSGADPNLQDANGDTALHVAARTNRADAAAILLEHGASITIENDEGQTAVDAATDELAQLLREAAVAE